MSEIKLNLARKWRSKHFEEIVGQDMPVRMLKNSLFLQQYFPVYLFSGQRGCGKTSTARVFASALNCDKLLEFRSNPRTQLPCMCCPSCKAMELGKHPDFIEIDAASHTGVDHVRMLIDSASLLPLMGKKKIYLIDEAHMLSKAAFNALLKILEEPPSSVIFMLATTDPHKIIETVRSRCFQLFFRSVDTDVLLQRLQLVCETEDISYDTAGLLHIVKQTEGSVRDALNLLETVRFSSSEITQAAVSKVLGYLDDKDLIALCAEVFNGNTATVLHTIKKLEWHKYSATTIWQRLVELIRTALWIKHDVEPDQFTDSIDTIKKIIRTISVSQLTAFLKMLYDKELLFSKTTAKHEVLEMLLVQMAEKIRKSNPDDSGNTSGSNQALSSNPVLIDEGDEDDEEEDDEEDEEEEEASVWKQFVASIEELDDPLVTSVFTQGTITNIENKKVQVQFAQDLVFFSEWLEKTRNLWEPLLRKSFGADVALEPSFTGDPSPIKKPSIRPRVEPKAITPSKAPVQARQTTPQHNAPKNGRRFASRKEPSLFGTEVRIDVSDAQKWPIATMLQKELPGTITEVRE